jgi:hypothetical protein
MQIDLANRTENEVQVCRAKLGVRWAIGNRGARRAFAISNMRFAIGIAYCKSQMRASRSAYFPFVLEIVFLKRAPLVPFSLAPPGNSNFIEVHGARQKT